MYNLLTGKYPFDDKNLDNLRQKILNGNVSFPSDDSKEPRLSDIAKDLILQILVKDPNKRPRLNQILYHDFFHIGTFPRFLDPSTLEKPPEIDYIKKYMPESEDNDIINKEVKMKNLFQLVVDAIPEVKYDDLDKYTLEYINSDINML